MAYVNLINEVLDNSGVDAGEAEVFMRFRDFVCKRNGTYDYSSTGIGWTLEDSSYAEDEDNAAINDWFVISSTGELGVDKMYYKCTLIRDYIRIHGWQYWNNSTHAGAGTSFFRDNAWYIANPVALYIYGDLDFVAPIIAGVDSTTKWSHAIFGCLDTSFLAPLEQMGTPVARNVQVCSESLTAGSDVSIVVPDASSRLWTPDCHLFIMDDANIERFLVKTNNGTTTLTADLTNSYAAGSRIAVCFPYIASYHYVYQWPIRSVYGPALHDMRGNLGITNMSHTNMGNTSAYNQLIGTGWDNCYAGIQKAMYINAAGETPLGLIPNCYVAAGTTGLTHEDLLDDVVDSSVKWRYCATDTPRFYKEV